MSSPINLAVEQSSVTNRVREVLRVEDLRVHFPVTRGFLLKRKVGDIKAVDGVSFNLHSGETFGLVGESGSGKTTIGRAILQLTKVSSGRIFLNGKELESLKGQELRNARGQLGVVFQDPYGSLNPRMKAGNIVGEPLIVHELFENKRDYRNKVGELLETVGLHASMADRYPHEFSGGQRQRLGVARAIAVRPEMIILDEPVSALDVSIQAQIINLLEDLQEEFGIAYLFIAHDLSVVRHISDRIAVMYLGKIVEIAEREELYDNPLHPYTQALLSAVPLPDPALERNRQRTVLSGGIPSPMNPPSGCPFHTRCPIAIDQCSTQIPPLREVVAEHRVACDLVK